MRRFVLLCEELEARPEDGDRVRALARWFGEVGRDAALEAADWLLPAEGGRRTSRPARLPLHRLHVAAREVAAACGVAEWLFDAGVRACRDPAEAVALNLPDLEAGHGGTTARDPTLAQWLQAWRAASAVEPADERARAVIRTIARLDDGPAKRWAVRAVCAMTRPPLQPWQWMRAWAGAFRDDLATLAWTWHTRGRTAALLGSVDLLADVPRPRPFARHVRFDPRQATAWSENNEEHWPEPHWRGPRVQVVRAGDAIALWHEEGELLNARFQSLLHAVAWPDTSAIEGVVIGWQTGRVVSPWVAAQAHGRPPVAGDEAPTLHLVLSDWHVWEGDDAAGRPLDARRARLCERWPEFEAPWIAEGRPPAVFVTPSCARTDMDDPVWRGISNGVLWRAAQPSAASGAAQQVVWHRPPVRRRVRVVLQYVPSEALGTNGIAALARLPSGLALWSRLPRTAAERTAAMARSLSPLTEPDPAALAPASATDSPARLLPLVRLPLALPSRSLARLQGWLSQHAGPRFGTMNTVLPALVFELSFEAVHDSRRHRVGVTLEDARLEAWLEQAAAGEADDLGVLHAGTAGSGEAPTEAHTPERT